MPDDGSAEMLAVLNRLGFVDRATALEELRASGLSVQPGTVTRHLVDVTYGPPPGRQTIRFNPTRFPARRLTLPLGVSPHPAPGPEPYVEPYIQNAVLGSCTVSARVDGQALVAALNVSRSSDGRCMVCNSDAHTVENCPGLGLPPRPKKSVWEWIRNPAL